MTIPASVSEISYQGNGVSKTFAVPFAFDVASDLRVILRDSDGNESSVSYTTTGGNGSTGTVVLPTAPAVGTTLVIYDDPEVSQQVDYLSNDGFPAETHEHALDKLTRIAKRTRKMIGRSLRVPDGENDPGTIPPLEQRIGMYLAFGPDGNPVPASGTGADAGLRADLASSLPGNGIDLVAGGVKALGSNLTFAVPTDYATLQEAIDELSKIYRAGQGVTITLFIESGHVLESGFRVEGGDFSYFIIQAADPLVSVAGTFTGDLFTAINCAPPVLDCLIDMGHYGRDGYTITDGCRAFIKDGAGIINAGRHGLSVRASLVYAPASIWRGAKWNGLRVTQVSSVSVQEGDISDCAQDEFDGDSVLPLPAVYVSRSSLCNIIGADISGSHGHGIEVRRSVVSADSADFSGAAHNGALVSYGAQFNAPEANFSGAGGNGVLVERSGKANLRLANMSGAGIACLWATDSSQVHAESSDCSNSLGVGVRASRGSVINAHNVDASGASSHGFFAEDGATIHVGGSSASAASCGGNGVYALSGSTINCPGINASGAGNIGILAERGSIINADGADATNATDRGIVAVRGSTINAHASDTTGFGGSTGYRILNGSFINATDGTGSTSETVNTLTANGVIFQ